MFLALIASVAGGLFFGIAAWILPEPMASTAKTLASVCGFGMIAILALGYIQSWWFTGRR